MKLIIYQIYLKRNFCTLGYLFTIKFDHEKGIFLKRITEVNEWLKHSVWIEYWGYIIWFTCVKINSYPGGIFVSVSVNKDVG